MQWDEKVVWKKSSVFGISDQLCIYPQPHHMNMNILELEYEDSWAEFLPSESAEKFLVISSGQSFAAYFEQ